ncbi:MAG: FkbM family methyltransferase [Sporomusaceae bacterium]|nr:FkbM family methyltransferase [Sporomusaceae bacterium]
MWQNMKLFGEIFNYITDLLSVLQKKQVVIFGAGKAGQITGFILNGFNIRDFYYVDNNQEKWGTEIGGKPVCSPAKLADEKKENAIILISSMYFDAIAAQLVKSGFLDKVHFHRILYGEHTLQNQFTGAATPIKRISHIQRSINLISAKIDSSMCIVDVGAYKGEQGDSTPEYASAFPHNTVYAFEPLQESYVALRENTRQYPNVSPVHSALSNKIGNEIINITSVSHSSSLLPINHQAVNQLKHQYMDILTFAKQENIRVTTLDEFNERNGIDTIAVLKIDTQGSEHLVLEGAARSLAKTILIVLEMNNNETYVNAPKYFQIDGYLRDNGFMLYDLIPSLYEKGKLYEYDAIYVNKNYVDYINNTEKYDELLIY